MKTQIDFLKEDKKFLMDLKANWLYWKRTYNKKEKKEDLQKEEKDLQY